MVRKEQTHKTLLWALAVLVLLKMLVVGVQGWTRIAVLVGNLM